MNFAIITAGGIGSRMHMEIPKQFLNDIPSRVVFRISDSSVCNKYDYMKNAEHLLGKGDMFFCPRGSCYDQLYRQRIQGAYMSKFDVYDIVDEISKINKKKHTDYKL